ncbi:MAG: DNA translocase FtsK 4TM domain-containing protein [Pseudomonadota bacterium]
MQKRLKIPRFRELTYRMTMWVIDLIRDFTAISLFGLGIITFLSCVTYSENDPSFLQATEQNIENLFGIWGSTYADFTLQTLGYAAYLIPAFLVIWGSGLFRGRVSASIILRLMYAPPVLMLFAATLDMLFGGFQQDLMALSVGGKIGEAISIAILYFPSSLGGVGRMVTIIATTLFTMIGVLFVAGRSFGVTDFLLQLLRLKNTEDKANGKSSKVEKDIEENTASTTSVFGKKSKKRVQKKKTKSLSSPLIHDGHVFPTTDLLQSAPRKRQDPTLSEEVLKHNAQLLESVLEDFGVRGEVKQWHAGPVVTLYELEPAAGIRSSRVIGLADDIARAMSAISARVAVIPGKNAIGIELPNTRRETVYLKDVVCHKEYQSGQKELPLGLGKDIGGTIVVTDLAKMPHLLIAGTTGSGKSVGINTMILSLLYKLSPESCKMIMIDPKMLELSIYNGIPHLLSPVVTNPKKAVCALKWVVREMEERYDMMSKIGVRKLSAFNERIEEARQTGETLTRKRAKGFDPDTGQPVEEEEIIPLEPLPYIVVVVDEMADLMLVAGKEIEGLIQRLAQMARAAGIHLIMATQRPSVDVITGTIKANFPTRISFQVTSKIDSRTILGEMGAEQLLGQGDMLFMESGGRIRRVHGAFVSDGEVENIVEDLKMQGAPEYIDDITDDPDEATNMAVDAADDLDPMFREAVEVVRRDQKASTSYVQRKLKIGYNRAARIIEEMEEQGIITPADHAGKREIVA